MADRKFPENEHAWVEERLSVYVDNQLAPKERVQLEHHLRDCARCQASLASLTWTLSLVKQVPVPTLPRSFTLPVPASTRRAPSFDFGFAGLATVAATLLLFAVLGVDAISQLGGGFTASAPAALQNAANPTSVALAPSQAQDQAKEATPTSPVRPLVAPQPTAAPAASSPAQPAALPPAPASATSPAPT